MTKRKKALIISVSVILIIAIAIGVFIFCIWGRTRISMQKVGYAKLQKLIGEDCPVPKNLEEVTVSQLNFPSGIEDPRGFYPLIVWGSLQKKAVVTMAISPSHPCVNYDTITVGENKKANGYSLSFKLDDSRFYHLEARAPSAQKNLVVGDLVNEFVFPNSDIEVAGIKISYLFVTEYRTLFLAFAMKKSVYCMQLACDVNVSRDVYASDVKNILFLMQE